MKKRNLKLGLQKMNISNLQNLRAVKGGQGSVQLCSETDCGETPNCETQGGYVCGETMATDCGIDVTLGETCFGNVCFTNTCYTYDCSGACFPPQ